jgi:hypothetical protein
MSSGAPDLFGVPLAPDPAIALRPLNIQPNTKSGPIHKVQFVIEFVGPRSIPAAAASPLLQPQWYEALGQPAIWVMRPSDLQWQPFVSSVDGSLDSLALTWDMVTPQGTLSSASALQLLQFAERFGPTISRRAMPMPHPAEVNERVRDLGEIVETLDLGFSIAAVARTNFSEKDLWIVCARLGLEFSPGGSFDWRLPGHLYPLLSVTPIGQSDTFSLGAVQAGLTHEGVSVGFSIPRCIAPVQALDACYQVAEAISSELGGQVLDDDGSPLSEKGKAQARASLKQALAMFAQAGITAGSPEALRLFG